MRVAGSQAKLHFVKGISSFSQDYDGTTVTVDHHNPQDHPKKPYHVTKRRGTETCGFYVSARELEDLPEESRVATD